MPGSPMPERWSAAAAVLLLALLLLLPASPGPPVPRLPLELPAIVLLLLAAPGRPARALVTLVLTTIIMLKLADLATEAALRRPFNPVLDGALLPAAWRLADGTLGRPLALAAAAAAAAAPLALAAAIWWATGRIAGLAPHGRTWPTALALPAFVAAGVAAIPDFPAPPVGAATTRLAWEHARDALRARADLARFRTEAAHDRLAAADPRDILPALRGADVFVVFVESYGRAALENPLYAPTITATLAQAEDRLRAAGLAMRSGYLTAPVVGGQSWLARATLLSGLRIDNQARYRALLASPRRTLLHLAQAAGWRTAAVVPAITLPWPEAGWFGYDRVLAAADLGYRGEPFNWVTMPDQFTLAAFERRLLHPAPRPPVFAEVALISSHAPWTPVPPLIPWEALGDGEVFDAYAAAGDPPEVVWRDPDRVREQYRRALGYSLRTLASFAERHAAEAPLIVALGDHPPAPFVSGDPAGRDVPVHVIGAPAAVARLDGWGWRAGLVPGPSVAAWPMAAFRDRFLAAFGSEPGREAAASP
jgi:hypothetical protein